MKTFLSILFLAVLVGCSTSGAPAQTGNLNPTISPIEVAKQQFHDGQLDSAALSLRDILKADPQNQAAYYYLCLVNQTRYAKKVGRQQIEQEQRQHWK